MGMRCKKHPFQAAAGVCATCLRDRLLVLAAAQNGGDASSSPPPQPPPVVPAAAFPRSVSPYVSRRKSDASGGARYGTIRACSSSGRRRWAPPAAGALEEGDIAYEYEKRRAGKFSVLATLFGHHHHHRSERQGQGKRLARQEAFVARRDHPAPPQEAATAGILLLLGSAPVAAAGEALPTPGRRPRQASSMPSGFAVCLSPLVRPSPGRRHRGGAQPPDPCSFSCELRPSPLHNLASITRCRSKKLADGGRFR
ncbi:hypothetical protein PR202_ga02342 [Eleusine coracana subsp. coracana]|uniref:Uncharacterized protein n=1 Tax=Eleusine coracana subsp. coracana TaxID=191504 RepID=A0AAV5BLG0_ELECO|nr:hypothetical protein PR202_ga02342 [Eleusine coracana subsp. coracana]